jgi:hypothetical protein
MHSVSGQTPSACRTVCCPLLATIGRPMVHRAQRGIVGSLKIDRTAQAIGRFRGGMTTKIHTLADGRGRSLISEFTPDQAADARQLILLLDQVGVPR